MADQTPLKNVGGEPGRFGSGDTIGTVHGGTGATTAAGARTNLDVPSNSDLSSGLATKQDTLSGTSDVPGLDTALAGKQDQSDLLDDIAGLTLTKGDTLVYDGSNLNKLDAGANGQVIAFNSATATGLEAVTVAGSPESTTTADNGTAGAITQGQPVYMAADGDVELAKADSASTCRVLGVVQDASVSAGNPATIQQDGNITMATGDWDALTGGSGGLIPGTLYYVSAATAGSLTATAPSTAGHVVAPVLLAISATEAEVVRGPRMHL